MTLADRLAAIAAAPDGADLAELLGVAPGALSIDRDGLTVAGETVSLAEARRALAGGPAEGRRTVTIGDLCPTSSKN